MFAKLKLCRVPVTPVRYWRHPGSAVCSIPLAQGIWVISMLQYLDCHIRQHIIKYVYYLLAVEVGAAALV